MSSTRRKGATPKKAHKLEVSFTNWMMGGSLLSLSTTSSLGSRIASKGSHKTLNEDTDDEGPPNPIPPAPPKLAQKKQDIPPPEVKKSEEVKAACISCQPEPDAPTAKCAPNCPVCNEECAWEKHMHEKYGGMECNTCGRGATWLMDEFHKGRGEYACEKCTPDCAACGRGPLWLSKKWEKTLKRRARKLQGIEKDKKDKKDDDGKKDKEDEGAKKGKGDEGDKAKEKGKEKADDKDKAKHKGAGKGGNKDEENGKDTAEIASVEKEKESASKNDEVEKQNQEGKNKSNHDWSSEEDAKLKELKSKNKSWKDIASELGINVGLCKARYKALDHSGSTAKDKNVELLSMDKNNASGGDGDVFLGGFGDLGNDDPNKNEASSGNADNQGWGAASTSNAEGDTSGAADNNGWGTNDKGASNTLAGNSSWENNNSNLTGNASVGDKTNSSWGNNNNPTAADVGTQGWGDTGNSTWDSTNNNATGGTGNQGWGDAGNSGWGNDDSNKTSHEIGGKKDNQHNQDKNTGGGKKQKIKNKGNKQDMHNDVFGAITESNPTGYIPYKSANTAVDEPTSWDAVGNASFTEPTAAQASGGLASTWNAEASGGGWDGPKTNWEEVNPSAENNGHEPVRDPWAQPEVQNDSGNGAASNSGNNAEAPAHLGDGWVKVTDSNLDMPANNTAPAWGQLKSGDGIHPWSQPGDSSQNPRNGGNSRGQDNNNSFPNDSWNKPDNGSQRGGGSGGKGNYSNNNGGNSWNQHNNTNQNSGNGGDSWGQGKNSNNGGNSWNRPNERNSSNANNFNYGNNGRGFNSPSGFSQGKHSRGKLRPNSIWPPQDCDMLEFLETKYSEHKWKQMQADFYNLSGRMIPSEQIEQKFRADGYA